MVLGPCTCITTSCENVDDVGCGGSETQTDLFCDGDVFFYDAGSFVYGQGGINCNVQGGSTTLECSCSAAALTSPANVSIPSTDSLGFSTDQGSYDNSMPEGPCQCDLAVTSASGAITYASIGDSTSAVYCDGGGDIQSVPNQTVFQQAAGSLYFECGRGYTNANAPSQYQLQAANINCRCTASTAPYYGGTMGTTAVAQPTAIASRLATLGKVAGSSSGAGPQILVGGAVPSLIVLGLTMSWMIGRLRGHSGDETVGLDDDGILRS